MKRPKLKRDWVGLKVKLLKELHNRSGTIFPAGAVMQVTKNYGGLHLEYIEACRNCRLRHVIRIKGIHERDVAIVE